MDTIRTQTHPDNSITIDNNLTGQSILITPDMRQEHEIKAHHFVKAGVLSIDTDGRIWRNKKYIGGAAQKLTPLNKPIRAENVMPNGYYQIQFYIDGKCYTCQAHRLVWYHFFGDISSQVVVHHINNNKQDNRPSNLLLMSYSDHNKHHPRTPWNKDKDGDDIREWHKSTVIIRNKNYLKRCVETHKMRNDLGLTAKEISLTLGITERSVHQRLADYRKRGGANEIHTS